MTPTANCTVFPLIGTGADTYTVTVTAANDVSSDTIVDADEYDLYAEQLV